MTENTEAADGADTPKGAGSPKEGVEGLLWGAGYGPSKEDTEEDKK